MVTMQVERIHPFFEDGQELFPLHYKELALNQDEIKLELDIKRYEKADEEGYLLIVTLRDAGKLVGYWLMALMPHLHYASVLCASTDMFWVKPEYRASFGAKFMIFGQMACKKCNVKKLYISCKVHKDLRPLFEGLGFTLSDYMFTKLVV